MPSGKANRVAGFSAFSGAAVLYVEDNDINWKVAEARLGDKFKLTRAANDREAFDCIRNGSFDVVLMDIGLEGSYYDGTDITQILRGKDISKEMRDFAKGLRLDPRTPVVYVTAYCDRYTRQELLRTGATDVVCKPIDFVRLVFSINRSLRRASAEKP